MLFWRILDKSLFISEGKSKVYKESCVTYRELEGLFIYSDQPGPLGIETPLLRLIIARADS